MNTSRRHRSRTRLREMLDQDVRLNLMARCKPMQGRGGEYFTNYAKTRGRRMTPMNVEGRPGLLVDTGAEEEAGAPGYVVVVQWHDGKVSGIRDFRYARYSTAFYLIEPYR